MVPIFDLTTIIRWILNVPTIIEREMSRLNTHSLIYCMEIAGRLDVIVYIDSTKYLPGMLYVLCFAVSPSNDYNQMINDYNQRLQCASKGIQLSGHNVRNIVQTA